MRKLDFIKLKLFREKMHLRASYLANLLKCSKTEYELMEEGKTLPSKEQLQTLCKVYNVSEEKFYQTFDSEETTVLARTEKDLTEHDKKQIIEFLNFQKIAGKKERDREFISNGI